MHEPNPATDVRGNAGAAAAASLTSSLAQPRAPEKVSSAFDVLGVSPPKTTSAAPDQGERFIAALTGERKSIPSWSGQPGTLRSWLKLLACWEAETTLHREKWGLRLYQSFPEGSQPRKIADQIPMSELLSSSGYDLVLTALMAKYRPFLDIAGPASIDKFFFSGDRARGESFANFLASKEIARQELETNLGERLNEKVAGRILLRQAHLSDLQRELISLRDQSTLMSFEEVAKMLRPLDRPEMIAQAANAELGSAAASKHYPVIYHDQHVQQEYEEAGHEESEEEEVGDEDEEVPPDGEDLQIYFEDRTYDEDESLYLAAYHSAYADVRKDLRDRRKERGFIKHNKAPPRARSSSKSAPKGRGRGRGFRPRAASKGGPKMLRGSMEDLQSRTKCFNCQELGHYARDCPLKGGAGGKGTPADRKMNFVVSRGSGGGHVFMHLSQAAWATTNNLSAQPSAVMRRTIAVFAGIQVRGCDAIVDTAAEDAVIGVTAMENLRRELPGCGLQPQVVPRDGPAVPCAGIGGEATLESIQDVPVAIAGIHALLRFHVLRDGEFTTPPLLPISFLEAVGSNIDLPTEKLTTSSGSSTSMTRLASGHRTVSILDFRGRQWSLPKQLRVANKDPFQSATATNSAWMGHSSSTASGTPSSSQFSNHNFGGSGENSNPNARRAKSMSVPASWVTFRAGEDVEAKAIFMMQNDRWSMQDMEEMLHMLQPARLDHFRAIVKTTNVRGSDHHRSFAAAFGAFAHGSFVGVTKATRRYPNLSKYIALWFRHQVPQSSFSSFSVASNTSAPLHRDVNNIADSQNLSVSFGKHKGGSLWIQNTGTEVWSKKSKTVRGPQGQLIEGSLVQTYHRVVQFPPKLWHEVTAWKGSRISLTAYTSRGVDSMSSEDLRELRDLHFPLRDPVKAQLLCEHVEWQDEEQHESQARHAEYDLEHVFEEVNQSFNATPAPSASWFERMISRAAKWILNSNSRPDLPKKKLGIAKIEAAWRRITFRILMMLATARQQMVVDEFYLNDELKEEQKAASNELRNAKDKKKTAKSEHINQGIGQPLSRSKAHKTFALEPSACQHPPDKLRCRANANSQWWTCTLCGSRWQRNDMVETIKEKLPATSENEPKLMGRRGQEFPKFLPAPRSRPQQGDKTVELDNYGRPKALASASSSETGGTGSMPSTTSRPQRARASTDARSPSRTRPTSHGTRMIQPLKKNSDPAAHETYEINTDEETWSDEEMQQVLLDAATINDNSPAPLRKLKRELQNQGWVVKTLLLLITWASTDWANLGPTFLGLPRTMMVWEPDAQHWSTSSTVSGSTSTTSSWCCYIFEDKMQKFNWVMDYVGQSIKEFPDNNLKVLNKATKEHLAGMMKTLAETESSGLKSPKEVGSSFDLNKGWDFTLGSHRKAALQLINSKRPSVILLGDGRTTATTTWSPSNSETAHSRSTTTASPSNSEAAHSRSTTTASPSDSGAQHARFTASLAQLQLAANRGFIVEHPSTESLNDLQSLLQHPQVYRMQLQHGEQSGRGPTILITNLEFITTTLSKRLSQKPMPLPRGPLTQQEKQLNVFVEFLLSGIRHHLRQGRCQVPQLQDSWSLDAIQLCCRHFQPRLRPTSPSQCHAYNINLLKFTGRRQIEKHFVGRPSKVDVDDWRGSSDKPEQLPWVGVTYFELEPQTLVSDSFKAYATWLAAGAAHHLSSYQTTEAIFQQEWRSIFPSHNILGEEARANRAHPPHDMHNDFDLDNSEVGSRDAGAQGYRDDDRGTAMELDSVDETMVRNELRDLKVPELPEPEVMDPEIPSPPADIRREVYRIHRNLGHPDTATLVRALKHAGVKPEILKWVRKKFQCPICKQKKPPAQHRPAHLAARTMPFNEVVGVDLFFVDRKIFLNVVCWGTNYQIVEIIEDKTSSSVALAMAQAWLAHYGPPMMVVCDQGTEFTGKDFLDLMNDNGTVVHFTDTASPWQNSRTEKAGGIFKSRLAKVCQDAAVTTDRDYKIAVAETAMIHNMYYDRSGFSPQQRVFGTNLRVPASLLSDDYVDRDLLQEPQSDYMKRSAEIREAAAKAWMERQDFEAISRALKTNSRTVDAIQIRAGDRVYVWRTTPEFRGWSGPGVVIQTTENGRSLWISLRGYLLKASREQTRLATTEENFGAELRKILAKGMLEDFEKGSLKHYRDVQDEGFPDDEVKDYELSEYAPSEVEELTPQEAEQLGLQPFDALPSAPSTEVLPTIPETPIPMEVEASTRPPSEPSPSEPVLSTTTSRRPSIRVDEASSGEMVFGPIRETRPSPMPYPMTSPIPSWPSPGQPHAYLEVMKSDDHSEKVKWWTDKARNRRLPVPSSPKTFQSDEAHAVYHHQEKRMFLAKKVDPPGHVDFRRLHEKLKKVFRKSRAKEIKSLLDSGAIKILTLEESAQFERDHPEHVLTSRYVDRWKPAEDGATLPDHFDAYHIANADSEEVGAKSRWTVVGWRDPDVHAIERSAPTPLTTSIYLAMQTAATKKWGAFVRDVKTAFLQSMPTTRKQKLAVRMPSCEHFPEYHPKQLILLLTEIYGLVSGPAWWRRSLLAVLVKELGYSVSPYDKCVLTLKADPLEKLEDQKSTQGIIVIEVDDVLEAGGERHREKMKALESRFRFGKVTSLLDTASGSGYAGRRLKQSPDFSFSYSMSDYVSNRLRYVDVTRKFTKKDAPNIKLTADEESQLRGVIAALNWAAREGRPDASATASILAGCFPNPTMADVIAVNQVVQFVKAKKVDLKIHAIAEDKVRHVVISDSAFDPTGKSKPQHGWLQGITSPALNLGEKAPVSLISWKSRKMKRKAGNTLLCESIALSTAMGALERQVATWESFTKSDYNPCECVDDEDDLDDLPTVLATEDPRYTDPKSVAIADAKSLFDALHAEQSHGEDDRSALEIAIIQQSLERLKGRIRWVPHNENPADGLTKLAGAHMEPMYRLLQSNSYAIEKEETVLSRGRQGECRLKRGGSTVDKNFGG
ncbi:GIP [Symbiodinium sp. CCMP2592]|nr:GIP [Symbiodinium sp. CCMP2592]